MQVGCGGAYHSWTPLYPDKSTAEQVGLLINTYSLLLDPQMPDLDTNGRRIYLNLGAWADCIRDINYSYYVYTHYDDCMHGQN